MEQWKMEQWNCNNVTTNCKNVAMTQCTNRKMEQCNIVTMEEWNNGSLTM